MINSGCVEPWRAGPANLEAGKERWKEGKKERRKEGKKEHHDETLSGSMQSKSNRAVDTVATEILGH